MSSTHEHQVEHAGQKSDEAFRKTGPDDSSVREPAEPDQEVPEPGQGPIPLWLIGLIALGIFWTGAYLFSFSGGFSADVFDFQPDRGIDGSEVACNQRGRLPRFAIQRTDGDREDRRPLIEAIRDQADAGAETQQADQEHGADPDRQDLMKSMHEMEPRN